ncbi:lysine N(6)-hydroxylase/L-ornithine N(5)-oxygenase family protein [Metabacillus fastidiosus]|uniref:lysine N(6)-hydroxylase/L-ornithine N(5)-oxygenase family protein n=1 Tax=Metabacillus fastidiosus TaxID=1458 RepID=UPI003D2E3E38
MQNQVNHNHELLDVIGIGLGPFNLGLAALLEQVPEVKAKFFEQKQEFQWHPGMLIKGTTLQVPFFADLVTMADPTSRYTFLNYLHEHNRLYKFYFLERFFVPRREYNHYCQWVASQLESCSFGKRVDHIERVTQADQTLFKLTVYDQKEDIQKDYYARHIVIGVGSTPSIPSDFEHLSSDQIFHSAHFLQNQERCRHANSITVIGSGQSAAEVFYTLLQEQEDYGYRLNWFTRSKGFFPMEYSKLGLEHFSPDYKNYFYELPQEKRDEIFQKQDLLYKGISFSMIGEIYDLLYENSVGSKPLDVHLQALTELVDIKKKEAGDYQLVCHQWEQDKSFTLNSEVVILATGYRHEIPSFLYSLSNLIKRDQYGRYIVEKDYTLSLTDTSTNQIFIQNGELHTHGVGAPDLGLGAHRSAIIINKLAGRDVYSVCDCNVFQQFGLK